MKGGKSFICRKFKCVFYVSLCEQPHHKDVAFEREILQFAFDWSCLEQFKIIHCGLHVAICVW
jgi:hypothetical protein